MKHSILVWPVVAFALFAGCASERGASAAGARRRLAGTIWAVESISGKAVLAPAEGSKSLQLILGETDRRVAAFGGVNRFGGSYEDEGQQLRFGPLIGTKMAGTPLLNAQERSFVEALERADRYQLVGDSLVLFKDDQPLVSLRARP